MPNILWDSQPSNFDGQSSTWDTSAELALYPQNLEAVRQGNYAQVSWSALDGYDSYILDRHVFNGAWVYDKTIETSETSTLDPIGYAEYRYQIRAKRTIQ